MRKIIESSEFGGAVFEGTRILVLNIQKAVSAKGADLRQILRSYPALDAGDLEAARAYKEGAKATVKQEPVGETKHEEDPKPAAHVEPPPEKKSSKK